MLQWWYDSCLQEAVIITYYREAIFNNYSLQIAVGASIRSFLMVGVADPIFPVRV